MQLQATNAWIMSYTCTLLNLFEDAVTDAFGVQLTASPLCFLQLMQPEVVSSFTSKMETLMFGNTISVSFDFSKITH